MARVLPVDAGCAESWGDHPALEPGPAARRRADSTAGRACAHRALALLGHPTADIPRGPAGAPVWPDGVVGSITHCPGYRASAVAVCGRIRSIGVDAEPHRPLPGGVLDRIASPAESSAIAGLAASGTPGHLDRVLFCAKEAAYKAWFPLTERWLGFLDAHVDLQPATRTCPAGAFTARVLRPSHPGYAPLSGRWLVDRGLILVGAALLGEEQ